MSSSSSQHHLSRESAPLVSIVMPIRNAAATLNESLESALGQTCKEIELIAVDDGSTDETPNILSAYAADPRLRVVRRTPGGITAALTAGVAHARGEFLARLDADDIAYPNRLEKQLAQFASNPDLVLLGTAVDVINWQGELTGSRTYPTTHQAVLREFPLRNPFVHSTIMIPREAFERAGGYRRALELAEDYDLWLRLAEIGEVANLPDKLCAYRLGPNTLTGRNRLPQAFAFAAARRCAEIRRRNQPDPLENRSEPLRMDSHDIDDSFKNEQAFFCLVNQFHNEPQHVNCADYISLASQARNWDQSTRRLAQETMLSCLTKFPPPAFSERMRALVQCLRLDPLRMPRAVQKSRLSAKAA